MKKNSFLGSFTLFLFLLTGCTFVKSPEKPEDYMDHVKDVQSVVKIFATTSQQVEQKAAHAKKEAQRAIDTIIALAPEKRTFENTFHAYDSATRDFKIVADAIATLNYVSKDEAVRDASKKYLAQLENFAIDLFSYNVPLYKALQGYAQEKSAQEKLSAEEVYYVSETLRGFKNAGLNLPDEKRAHVVKLTKELSELGIDFEDTINKDQTFVTATREELAGVDEHLIKSLEKTDDTHYKITLDYPVAFGVLDNCEVAETRKRVYFAFANRAYPHNKDVLLEVIQKRDELAHALGFASYAALNLDDEMVKTPERAHDFLQKLLAKSGAKEMQEYALLIKDLPASVVLSTHNKFEPWDISFVKKKYKKKHFNLDDTKVAEYFPMEKTVAGLLDIYKLFFGLDMREVPVKGLWDADVKMIEIYRTSDGRKLGYLLLDLFPRPFKYSHACEITIIPALKNEHGEPEPAVAVVLANFPKSTPDRPSLLKHDDVKTFFHEFGHAIHAILGATRMAGFSGTNVKRDFVELPSQMLEEWMYEKEILQQISSNYKTGEPLPDAMIDAIITLKKFDSGYWVQRQGYYSLLSLGFYGPGALKDLDQITADLYTKTMHSVSQDAGAHMYASFGHLMGYGARYYGYLWSKVFALDLFEFIKQHGLLNPEIGKQYAQKILGKGGTQEPDELLRDFLGREPRQDAFLKSMGL